VLAFAATFAGASPAMAATAVPLGTLDGYNVLAATTVTNTGATVVNDGDVGLSPGSAVDGFPPGIINDGVKHVADAQALQAQSDWTTAFDEANSQASTQVGVADLSGLIFTPGVYDGDVISNTGTVTLSGTANSVFIFRAASAITIANASTIVFSNGASPCNVFWTVDGSATIGTTATFVGTLLARTSISAATGATIGGRLLASTGAVTLQGNTINRDVTNCGARPAIVPSTPVAGGSGSGSGSGSATAAASGLPGTGVDPLPLGIPAALVLIVGAALVFYAARRRRAAR
jgi:Ice-binding-like